MNKDTDDVHNLKVYFVEALNNFSTLLTTVRNNDDLTVEGKKEQYFFILVKVIILIALRYFVNH